MRLDWLFFLWLWFQCVCPLLPFHHTYHFTWVSLTLDIGYFFTAAPAKCSHCSLPWTRSPLLTLNMEFKENLSATPETSQPGTLGHCPLSARLVCGPSQPLRHYTRGQSLTWRNKIIDTEIQSIKFKKIKWIEIESAALNMPANLENSAVSTGLERVSFHSNPKERQCQRMLKLPHNCTHLTS